MGVSSWVLALALGASLGGPAGQKCRVHSRAGRIHAVTVHPKGVQTFDVKLSGVPLSVAPPTQRGAASTVHVVAPIEFEGEAAEVGYVARWRVITPGGLVTLVKGTVVDHLRTQGGHAVGNVVFEQTQKLDKKKKPYVIDQVVATDQPLSCAALNVSDRARAHSNIRLSPKTRYVSPRGHELSLFQWPGAGRKVVLKLGDPTSIYLRLLAERPTELSVELRYRSGARVTGWVPRTSVEQVEPVHLLSRSGYGSGCGVARDFIGSSGTFEGPVVIQPGARIFAERGRGVWATVPRGKPLRVRVLHRLGQQYAMILALPGIADHCNVMDHAFVDKRDVQFPSYVGPR